MAKNPDLKKVLVIGSGPIVIGQGAEFDYAGTQACKSLREEGVEVVLINSNPATIMTDKGMADKIYIEPLNAATLERIIKKEKPDAILAGLGGQTALNLAMELSEKGVLDKHNVKLLGTSLASIKNAEDRESFKNLMEQIGEPVPLSAIVNNLDDALEFASQAGYPLIVRPAYTLGGTGGGCAHNEEEFINIVNSGLLYSRINQVLIECSVGGWREIEYEVMRDSKGDSIIICDMENIDPVGIHTGDSIVVAPTQSLTLDEHKMLRSASYKIIEALKVEGGCNIQFALHPDNGKYVVIEVNPRVSRSSALASKATGFPIAKISSKIALGINLCEMTDTATGKPLSTYNAELDYTVLKIPKWAFDKFAYADRTLGTQMKATGEVMALGSTFESAFLKGIIALEGNDTSLRKEKFSKMDDEQIKTKLPVYDDEHIYCVFEALRRFSIDEVCNLTKMNKWFISKFKGIVDVENALKNSPLTRELLHQAEEKGFTDLEIMHLSGESADTIDVLRRAHGIYPVYKKIQNHAGDENGSSHYYYSAFSQVAEDEPSEKQKVVVIGSGPIRIGQGIEFDYCSVHAAQTARTKGYEAIIINNNPETVSTDFNIADKLYFEPLYIEDVYNVIRKEMPRGVIVQFGGQTAINLAPKLLKKGVQILGTSVEAIDVAEDRKKFERLLKELNIKQPQGYAVTSAKEALDAANKIGYPVLVRPSYVIGGRAMQIVNNDKELNSYIKDAVKVSDKSPVLVDKYIIGKEIEVDAISDGKDVLIPGIMEHIERTGVHSGDSISVYPAISISQKVKDTIVDYTTKLARALRVIGLMNIQFIVVDDEVYIIEVNPRASRTVPILSKATGIPMVQLATNIVLGEKLSSQGYGLGLRENMPLFAVKVPVFSFQKLNDVDVALSPEMKSTGEVLGVDKTYQKALLKGFLAAGYTFPKNGDILLSIRKEDRDEAFYSIQKLCSLGFKIHTTQGTGEYLRSKDMDVVVLENAKIDETVDKIKHQKFALVVNIPKHFRDKSHYGFKIRSNAQLFKTPCFTCLDTLNAYIDAYIENQKAEKPKCETMESYK